MLAVDYLKPLFITMNNMKRKHRNISVQREGFQEMGEMAIRLLRRLSEESKFTINKEKNVPNQLGRSGKKQNEKEKILHYNQ